MIISNIKTQWKMGLTNREEIIRQRMIFLLSNLINTCILNRDFGVDTPIDSKNVYENTRLKNRIMVQAKEFVPEFKINNIKIFVNTNGKVEVQVGGEVLEDD